MQLRYRDFNSYLRGIFGCRVQKIVLDAGLSCPNRDGTLGTGGCLYCNPRGSGTGAAARGLSITEQLERAIPAMARRYKAERFIAYFQSYTNTYAPLETLARMFDEALAVEGVVGLSVGTRPDCVDPPVLDMLAAYARRRLVWLEYGLQSANDATLARIHRGHDVACFSRAAAAARERGLPVCAHVILGLPGEGTAEMRATAEYLAGIGIDGVKIHLLYVVRGTGMERLYRAGGYRCLSQRRYAELVCDVLERLPQGAVIQRLTGDPHPEELVAPRWALDKAGTRRRILARLAERDTWQGKLAGGVAAG